MELQLLIILSIVIIVLQLVTIFMVAGSKKRAAGGRGETGRRPGAPVGENRAERGPAADPRRGNAAARKPGIERSGRPPQSGRPQSQPPAAAGIDPMEKSLRDINLRLKNAEREQENARKKIQEGGSRDVSRPPRGDRYDRNDRGGSRIDRGGRRDFSRDRPGEGRLDRPNRGYSENAPRAPESAPEAFQERPQQQFEAPPAPDIAVSDINVSEDQLQHGRKFTAKRRPLPAENFPGDAPGDAPSAEPAAQPQFSETAPETPETPNVQNQDESAETGNIQYGR